MVYRRRRIIRRRPRRRTAWYNRKYSTAQIARAAWRATKYIKGLVNSEMFHHTITVSSTVAQNQITQLNAIAQGDTAVTRTGNSILMRNLILNGYVEINPSVTGDTRMMVALVLDKQQVSDTSPIISDIFQYDTNPVTLLNLNNSGRFSILYRKQFSLSPASGGSNVRQLKIFKNMRLHARFNGTASTDIQKNGLYLVVISSEATNTPSWSFQSRIGYHDN